MQQLLSGSAQSRLVREVEVSELLRVYLGRMTGHLPHLAPSAGTTAQQQHGSMLGKESTRREEEG